MTVRQLTDDDAADVGRLSQLAFGYSGELPATLQGKTFVGEGDTDGLAGIARLRHYEQWWGGRRVRMGGIASVAVHPHARGRGTGRRLMLELLGLMRELDEPVSVLYPTAAGIYRRLGWEVVGTLDDTTIPTAALGRLSEPAGVRVRAARPEDVPVVRSLYDALARSTDGLLARDGIEFPASDEGVLAADVVALAEVDGHPAGYVSYQRGSGYRGSQLRVHELVAERPEAAAALLRSLSTWDSVAATVLWRGPTSELGLLLPAAVPPATAVQPWMLRIVDAPAAVAARGFPGRDADVAFALVDPDVPAHARGWRLVIESGTGRLEPVGDRDLPQLHVRGLALLWAGAGDAALVRRAGLLDRPLPALDRAFAGQQARILDYF